MAIDEKQVVVEQAGALRELVTGRALVIGCAHDCGDGAFHVLFRAESGCEKGKREGCFRLPRPTQVYRHCVPSNRGFTIDSCVRKGLSHEAVCKETANPSSVPHPLWLEDDSSLTYLPGL